MVVLPACTDRWGRGDVVCARVCHSVHALAGIHYTRAVKGQAATHKAHAAGHAYLAHSEPVGGSGALAFHRVPARQSSSSGIVKHCNSMVYHSHCWCNSNARSCCYATHPATAPSASCFLPLLQRSTALRCWHACLVGQTVCSNVHGKRTPLGPAAEFVVIQWPHQLAGSIIVAVFARHT